MGFLENKKNTEYHQTYSLTLRQFLLRFHGIQQLQRSGSWQKQDLQSENITKHFVFPSLHVCTDLLCGLLDGEIKEPYWELDGFGESFIACCIVVLPKEELFWEILEQ